MPIERDINHFFIDEIASKGIPDVLRRDIHPDNGQVWFDGQQRILEIYLNGPDRPMRKEAAAVSFLNICQAFFDPQFETKYPMDLIPDEGNETRNNPWGDSWDVDRGFRWHPEIPWLGVDKIAVSVSLEGEIDPSFGTAPTLSVIALETLENFRRVDSSALQVQAFFHRCLEQGQNFKIG